jgi:hypothetical protein
MIPISAADEELFSVMIAAVRLGRAGPIIDRLRARYDQEWGDPLAGFPYTLVMFAGLWSGREDLMQELSYSYTEMIETCSDVLYHLPDHWLCRYLRIHVRALLPDEGAHVLYINSERARAVEDVRELIERQDRADWRPWFACPYLLAARLAWQADSGDRDAVAALVTAAAARPGAPVRFRSLGGIMYSAFGWYRDRPELPEQGAVDAMTFALFPNHPAVRQARSGRAA